MTQVTIKSDKTDTRHLQILDSEGNDVCQHLPVAQVDIQLRPNRQISAEVTLESVMLDAKAEIEFDDESKRILNNLGWLDREDLPESVHEFTAFLKDLHSELTCFSVDSGSIDYRMNQGSFACYKVEKMLQKFGEEV